MNRENEYKLNIIDPENNVIVDEKERIFNDIIIDTNSVEYLPNNPNDI